MSVADNFQFYAQNLVDLAALSASSAVSTLPVTNLADYRPTIVHRTTGCNAEYVQADFGSSQTLQAAIAWNHNWTNASKVRFRVSDNADMSSPSYDSGLVNGWPSIVGAGEGGAGIGGAGGAPILSGFNQWRAYRVLLIGGNGARGRYARLDIQDPTNPAGYVQMGRLYFGSCYQPPLNPDKNGGLSLQWKDLGASVRTDAGSVRLSKRGKFREMTLKWSLLPESEILTSFDDLARIIGSSRDMFVVAFPKADLSKQYRTTLYAVATVIGPAVYATFRRYTLTMIFQELT